MLRRGNEHRESLTRDVAFRQLSEDSYEDVIHRMRDEGEWYCNLQRLSLYFCKSVPHCIDRAWTQRNTDEPGTNTRRLAEYHKRRDAYARLGLA